MNDENLRIIALSHAIDIAKYTSNTTDILIIAGVYLAFLKGPQ